MLGDFDKYVEQGIAIDSNDVTLEGTRFFEYDNGRWKLTNGAKESMSELKGKVMKSQSGNLYEFAGYKEAVGLGVPILVFKDVKTGDSKIVMNAGKLP